jgi:hypothetical protein
MFTRRLDVNALLREARVPADAPAVGQGPRDL